MDKSKGQSELTWFKLIVGLIFLAVVALTLNGAFYRLDTGYGAIVTHIGGNKDSVTGVGWHFLIPFFEHRSIYPVVNDYIYFPSETTLQGAGSEASGVSGVEINAKDDTVVDVSAITYFDRIDLFQWGVKNVDPDIQFDRAVSGIIRDVIQTSSAEDILHSRNSVETEIFNRIQKSNIEAQYGVEITKFQFQHTSYIDAVVKANGEKQRLALEAQGRLEASRLDAEALKINADAEAYKANALKSYDPSVLQYMASIQEYNTIKSRTGDVVWIIPSGTNIVPTIPTN